MIKDNKITDVTGIPYQTIQGWKRRKTWQKQFYLHMRMLNEQTLRNIFAGDISSTNTGLSDTKISEITKIPLQTINSWKKEAKQGKNTYRIKIYLFLKSQDESKLRT
ncbi:hypothetical protein IY804_04175, partial [Campylobacter volucris]|uniref:hypothetical protein n=1 Tax=Campylobacter volucris TaxID=1031542 RepID=UPI00189D002E